MSENGSFFSCIPMAVFSSASMTGSYQSLNTTGFSDNIKALKFYNGTNKDITLSYSGTTDEDFAPAGSTFIVDLQTNHHNQGDGGSGTLNGRKGQIVYGKGTAGTGSFYIIGYK